VGFTDCRGGAFNDATTCGFAAGAAAADATGAFLATAPGLAGIVSFIPILSGISAVMSLARTSWRTGMRCRCAIEVSVSPDATTCSLGPDGATAAGCADGLRGRAAWASLAGPPRLT